MATQIDQHDMDAFTKKLQEWGKDLPSKERDLLELIIVRSEGAVPVTGQVTTTVATRMERILRVMSSHNPLHGLADATNWKDWPQVDAGTPKP